MNEKDLGFLLEGSLDEKSWIVVYRGNATSTQIRDHEMRAFRVAALKKQLQVVNLATFIFFALYSNRKKIRRVYLS